MSGKGGRKKIILDEEEEEDYEVAAPLPSLKSGSSQSQGSSLPPSDEPLTSNGSSVPSRKEQPSPASKKIDLVAEEDNEEVEIVPRSNGRSSSSSSSSSSSRSTASSSSTSSSSSNSSKRGSSAQAKRVKAEPMEEDEDFVETGSTTNGRSTSSASASSAEKKRKRSVIQAESEDDDFDAAAEEDEEEEPEDEDADFEPAEKPKASAPVVKKQKVSSTKARSTKKEKDTKKKGSRSTSSSSSSSTKKRTPSTKSGSSSSTSRRRKTAEADGKAKKAATTSRKGKKAVKKEGAEGGEEMEVVEGEEEQWKWWLDEPLPKGVKWRTLEHNGVLFPPPYQPHGVKMLYDGEEVDLTPEQEEVATFYAQYLETPHTKKEVFNRNFFKEFRKMLKSTPQTYKKITQFQKCDFRPINRFLQQRKEERQNRTKEEKLAEKEEKQKELDLYGWAMVDGHKQKVGNFRVEPPGLFLGRGAHPKTGHLKQRIQPEDITINIGKEAIVPECPIPGHKWGAIVHNNEVTWLAFWRENINGAFKYVWLAPSSRIKGMADMKKFENSRKLCKHIYKIRRTYEREMKAKEKVVRQRATALWVIDHLALRVGNEKGEDEADTVGCCSLRVEHVKLKKPNIIKFDFLGKDSMRYKNSVEVPRQVFRNFKLFMKGKKPSADLFDHLTTTNLNAHLKEQMKGLTAKVFRTYNASITLEKELAKPIDPEATVAEKVLFYNRANREVAILCNHQRSLPPKHTEQMERLKEKKDELLAEKKELRRRLKLAKQGKRMEKEWTIPRKVKKEEKKEVDVKEGAEADGKGKGKSKAKAATATKKDEKKPVKEEKLTKSLPVDSDKIKAAITRLDARINACEVKMTEKEELKTVALGTSKINYLDPRITAAWCKRVGVPIEKIFNKTLRAKFPWAMDVDADWAYHPDGPGAYAKEEERKSGSSSSSSSKSRRSSTSGSKEEKKNEEKKEEEAEEEGMEEYVDEEIEEVEEEIEEEEEEVEEEEEDAQDSAYEEE